MSSLQSTIGGWLFSLKPALSLADNFVMLSTQTFTASLVRERAPPPPRPLIVFSCIKLHLNQSCEIKSHCAANENLMDAALLDESHFVNLSFFYFFFGPKCILYFK